MRCSPPSKEDLCGTSRRQRPEGRRKVGVPSCNEVAPNRRIRKGTANESERKQAHLDVQ